MGGREKPVLRPEQDAVLWSARVYLNRDEAPQLQRRLELCRDWNELLNQAQRHGMKAVLHSLLGDVPAGLMPEEVLESLERYYRSSVWNHIIRTRKLLYLWDRFMESGIRAIPFKGPVVAAALYDNAALRPYSDLDLLVRRKDVISAGNVLAEAGYGPAPRRLSDSLKPHHQEFYDSEGLRLELHWDLTPVLRRTRVPYNDLWRNLETVGIMGKPVQVLGPEVSLIALCVHGVGHGWQGLRWLLDVACLLKRNPEMDWNKVIDYAGPDGAIRILFPSLLLCAASTRIVLPQDLYGQAVRECLSVSLYADMERLLFADTRQLKNVLALHTTRIRLLPTLRDRLFHIVSLAMPREGDQAESQSSSLKAPVYYWRRLATLFRKYRNFDSARKA